MFAKFIGRLSLFLCFLMLWLNAGIVTANTEVSTINRTTFVSVTLQKNSVFFSVNGLSYEDITVWTWNGVDITVHLQAAVSDGSAKVHSTTKGCSVEWRNPPVELELNSSGVLGVNAMALSVTADSGWCLTLT
ncbi:hypothetical protein CCP3SC1_200017 [Gammaproteobacteria bacterium]